MPHKILLRRPQIWIPEIEYYQKMSSHAQIGSQGAEKQQSKVKVVVGGGGGGWWWWWVAYRILVSAPVPFELIWVSNWVGQDWDWA